MSRLTDLVARAKASDPRLGKELEDELQHLMKRQHFGLVFERHLPEAVELPNKPVRPRDKVRILPPRGSKEKADPTLWKVQRIVKTGAGRAAELIATSEQDSELTILPEIVPLDNLIVVAEVTDTFYPGLVETGRVERGTSEDPYHTVINAENFHALEMLTYTHRHSVDVIYIDPPYNTGAKDWKYNNDYVDSADDYRHSKWLSFMERRLLLARELLDPDNSVLVVTIDEKEVNRLGILLEQIFPDSRIQMISSAISSQGSARDGMFTRAGEYIYFLFFGAATVAPGESDMLGAEEVVLSPQKKQVWFQFIRHGEGSRREDRKNHFFPIFVESSGKIHSIGDPIELDQDRHSVKAPENTEAVWPIAPAGHEARWKTGVTVARRRMSKGLLRAAKSSRRQNAWSILSVNQGIEDGIDNGEVIISGYGENGEALVAAPKKTSAPKTIWHQDSHNAGWHGSRLISAMLPGRRFPFPKSLYAVEDTLRFLVKEKPNAVILDFFAGSGTTAHAVMRLNKQDGGSRQSILVTNNEVSAEEQKKLQKRGLRPGDGEWEALGICDYITKPRIRAAITGNNLEGAPLEGDYKFTDDFPMSDGFETNAAFFTLTYENSLAISYHKAFEKVAPLLWLRAGSVGKMIDQIPEKGWDVADTYAILENLDRASEFVDTISQHEQTKIAYIVTDDDRRFQMICQSLPSSVEPVRLYQSYLLNFQLNNGRGVA